MPKKTSSTTDTVVFNGIRFNRYPNSKNQSDSRYYRPSAVHIRQGVGYLHQEVWKSVHGEIPAGYHIHHIDHNTLNNDIGNLEAVEKYKHMKSHMTERAKIIRPDGRTNGQAWIESARSAAVEWHKSSDGSEWHKMHAKKTFGHDSRVERLVKCENCGEEYTTVDFEKGRVSFCSAKCRSAYRRKSGVDNVERECAVCGDKFTVNKYSKQYTCSRKCGARAHGDATLRKNGRL